MDANLRKMSEYFGPGCRVLNVRFVCIESEEGGNPLHADCSPKSSRIASVLSARQELAVATSSALPRWRNHPVPGGAIRPQVCHLYRRRSFSASRRKSTGRLGRTPVLLMAAGVALSLLLAVIAPNVNRHLKSAFGNDSLSARLTKVLNTGDDDVLKVDGSVARDYHRSVVDWQERYARVTITTPCYATVNVAYDQ